jgi:hypothetical protein
MNTVDCFSFVFPEYVKEPPKQNNSLPDLRNLAGQSKADAIKHLNSLVDSTSDKEIRFRALQLLESDSWRQLTRIRTANEYFNNQIREMQLQAIEDFKVGLKVKFYSRFSALIQEKKFTAEMMRELDIINKMEKACCYQFEGIKVWAKECNKCDRRKKCFGEE